MRLQIKEVIKARLYDPPYLVADKKPLNKSAYKCALICLYFNLHFSATAYICAYKSAFISIFKGLVLYDSKRC